MQCSGWIDIFENCGYPKHVYYTSINAPINVTVAATVQHKYFSL